LPILESMRNLLYR